MNCAHRQRAIDRGVEERVEVVVGVRHAVLFAQALVAPHVAAPHQEHRRRCDPVHRADPVGDLLDARGVAHHDDGVLLQVGLGRRRLRRGEQRIEQRVGYRLVGVAPRHPPIEQRRHCRRHFHVRQIDPEACPQQFRAIRHGAPLIIASHTCRNAATAQGCDAQSGGDCHAGTVRNASRADQSHPARLGHAGGERRTDRRNPLLGRSARCGQPWHVDAARL